MIEEQDAEKSSVSEEVQAHYFIDLKWYQEQGRSFILLAASRLCPRSHDKKTMKSESALLNTIKQCCSKHENFIRPNLPLQEMVFRIFLANGNQPLNLEQLQEKLQHWISVNVNPRDISISKLKLIIEGDRYYGLRAVPPDRDK